MSPNPANSDVSHNLAEMLKEPISEKISKVRKIYEDADSQLTAYAFKGNSKVEILHGDGTKLLFRRAFVEEYVQGDVDFIIVLTEHTGVHVFCAADLDSCTFTIEFHVGEKESIL